MNGVEIPPSTTDMQVFGLDGPFFCEARKFFSAMNHPGASNCECPKFDNGVSCVPTEMWGAWFAYIGLKPMKAESCTDDRP